MYKTAEFCLLEQILPGGPSVPFAQAMLQHFVKLGTPLKCVHEYPTIDAQEKRFRSLGWLETRCWSLWQAWKDTFFLSSADRCQLDKVEVFDEWEEFAHFASHYFLLHASNSAPSCGSGEQVSTKDTKAPTSDISLCFSPVGQHKNTGLRRFGVPLIVKDALGDHRLANLFGIGTDCRLSSYDVYSAIGKQMTTEGDLLKGGGPPARTFSALTDIGDAGYLLTGGRASPTSPFRDTWVIKKDTYRWQRAQSLPLPLFRHSVARLHNAQLALLAGGKSSPSAVFSGYLLYHPANGWTECTVVGPLRPPPLFGAVLFCSGRVCGESSAFHGTLAGGMTTDNVVNNQAVRWVLDVSQAKVSPYAPYVTRMCCSQVQEPTIRFESPRDMLAAHLLSRFGAACTQVDGWTVLVGGIADGGSVLEGSDILRYCIGEDGKEDAQYLEYGTFLDPETPRPVLVGASVIGTSNGEAAIVGGGMTCFSMGSVWSKGLYKFRVCPTDTARAPTTRPTEPEKWEYVNTSTISDDKSNFTAEPNMQTGPAETTPVPRLKLVSKDQFLGIIQDGKPAIFEGLNLGSCTAKWDTDYLAMKVGPGRNVS